MGWFKRLKEGIQTTTSDKKEVPDGIWTKCPKCKETTLQKEFKENYYVCPHCDHHTRIGSREYFHYLFENDEYELLFGELEPKDILNFEDLKKYKDRLKDAEEKTNLKDAISVAVGEIEAGYPLVIAAMDFAFIGGSMGSVVGEKISLAVDYCIEHELPLMIISKSGGARMMESAFSLMQMAKTSVKLGLLSDAGLPYISLLTDPTTGGVTASFSMLGDLNIAEPKALIGFAGPRVIKETIKQDLPEGFQSSEFLLEQGFLDFIVHRKDLKSKIVQLLRFFGLKKSNGGDSSSDAAAEGKTTPNQDVDTKNKTDQKATKASPNAVKSKPEVKESTKGKN
ncbi:acetyl-CoA carboxylase, carboxyltransferase subunit beta [Membranicola marinus]|uniref:Acetyl-coenzyme A carboxylase carboxyl transferase subunit beta n=1 Tax=Membranihabitans marinus TaxID=1227546 RepID=A0A953HSC9_9BACT|nr:acetyl-CoA carboxylase, carboxyltransferase subunit beta [Membranihabitans marinus]MBY5957018.1 acetyl-CoA carboxylase, carboxyltransferase subunit beta [Membranihabitans marinus]